MYNKEQDIELQADRFEEEEQIRDFLNSDEGNVDDETAAKLNQLLYLRNDLDNVWRFHPNNPNHTNLEQYCFFLNAQIAVLEKELGIEK